MAGEPAKAGDLKRKIVRGVTVLGVLVVVVIGVLAAVPGLKGVRSAITSASPGWIAAAFAIDLIGLAGATVFVQAVFDELPRRLSWWQGLAMQGANAALPTAGSTGVSYWSVSSVGWETPRFVKRTAVMIIAPAAPNLLLIFLVGIGMGLGLLSGPGDWWLTWLPAGIALALVVAAVATAHWSSPQSQPRIGPSGSHAGSSGASSRRRSTSWRPALPERSRFCVGATGA